MCNLTAASLTSSTLNVYHVCFLDAPTPVYMAIHKLNLAELFFKMVANENIRKP